MKLTTDEALQQAMTAHKEGKFQDAERLYRAILQTQPKHPDANYNLGVLAISANKADAALPLFKTALKANPKKERFWFSYIDALIREQKFKAAKQVIEQVKSKGMAADKLTVFEKQIPSPNQISGSQSAPQKKNSTFAIERKKSSEANKDKKKKKKSNVGNSPTDAEVNELLLAYRSKKFNEAEELAISLTERFPKHPFSWKILGALFGQSGRHSEAAKASQTAAILSPQDAGAHINLGVMLKELGKLDEAEASYKKAIALQPDVAEAHYNLGITLQELGKLDEAKVSYVQAIALKPDVAEAHYNLGITLQKLGKLNEAEASYLQAIALKPDVAEAHYNLGNTLQKLGKLNEAEASYLQAIALKPDISRAHYNLGNTLQELGKLNEAERSYKKAIALNSDVAKAQNNLGITLQELGKLDEAKVSYKKSIVLKPNRAEAHYNLGVTLQELGKLDEAEKSYMQAIALEPENFKAHNELLMCLYLQDKKSTFFDQLDHLIIHNRANAVIGSLTCRSALKYGLVKPNLFCEKPLEYVLHTDLNTRYDFEEIFVKKAKSILDENRISSRRQSLLVNGYQTHGNLFDIQNDSTNEIQKAIRFEIEKYRNKFKNSEEGLIKKWPTEYSLYGWLISMKSGGEIQPHIHSQGWLSGSIYINNPPKTMSNAGNLVVSLGEEQDATDTHINLKNMIDVVTGSLVLFPASLTHYTIPFESEEERIVLAFDVKQK